MVFHVDLWCRRVAVIWNHQWRTHSFVSIQPQAVSVDIVHSEDPKAFVLPGGRIYVTTGLLQLLETENGLAMVLAHEWAHQHLRHPIKGLGKGIVIATALAVITGTQDNAWLADLLAAPCKLD